MTCRRQLAVMTYQCYSAVRNPPCFHAVAVYEKWHLKVSGDIEPLLGFADGSSPVAEPWKLQEKPWYRLHHRLAMLLRKPLVYEALYAGVMLVGGYQPYAF